MKIDYIKKLPLINKGEFSIPLDKNCEDSEILMYDEFQTI